MASDPIAAAAALSTNDGIDATVPAPQSIRDFKSLVIRNFAVLEEAFNALKQKMTAMQPRLDGLDLQITEAVRKTNAIHANQQDKEEFAKNVLHNGLDVVKAELRQNSTNVKYLLEEARKPAPALVVSDLLATLTDRLDGLERKVDKVTGPRAPAVSEDIQMTLIRVLERLDALEQRTAVAGTPVPVKTTADTLDDLQLTLLALNANLDQLEPRVGSVGPSGPIASSPLPRTSSKASSLVVSSTAVSVERKTAPLDDKTMMTNVEKAQLERAMRESMQTGPNPKGNQQQKTPGSPDSRD
jgi:hypothetical protein